MSSFGNFLLSFTFNLLVAIILVRFIYYPSTHSKRYVLTFLAFNSVIYFVLYFMTSIEIGIGVGFGLFAIFTILRYRTDPMPVREMTYLFIIAALPVMNASASEGSGWPMLISANIAVLGLMYILEKGWGFKYEASKRVVYEKIELIQPNRREELMTDLEMRTGLKIKRVSIGKINFLKDTVELTVYYNGGTAEEWSNDSPVVIAYSSADLED